MSRARDFANLAGSADVGGITGRNMIINGNMAIAQRGTSSTASGHGSVDRHRVDFLNFDQLGVTRSQSTITPSGQGFSNSLKVAVTTQETTLDTNELFVIRQIIEAQNLQHLAYGTSSAKSLTLSFWVRSSLAGKYSVLFYSADSVRSNLQSFTISSSDTWEFVTITIDGDTAGIINNDNGSGLQVTWVLAAGTDWTGTPHTGWGAFVETDDYAFSDQVNFAAQTGEFYITGVQLEVGEVATPFEHESFAETLRKCQRYYSRINSNGNYTRLAYTGYWASGNQANLMAIMPVPMRAAPAVDHTGTLNDYILVRGNGVNPPTTLPAFSRAGLTEDGDCMSATIIANSTGNGSTEGHAAQLTSPGGGATGIFLGLEAEL